MMATVTVPSVATRDNLIREIRGIRENLIPPEACLIPAQIVPDKDVDVDAAPSQAPAPEEVSNDKPLDDDVKKNAYRDKGDEGIQKKNADIISLLLEPPSRRYKTIDKISKSMSGVSGGFRGGVSAGHDHGDPSRRSHGYSAFIGRHSKEGFDSDGSSDATSDGSAYASSYASYQRLKNHRSDSTYKRSMFVGAESRMTSSISSSGYRRRGPELLPTKFRYTNHSELRHRSVNDGDVTRKSRALTAAAAVAAATKKNGDRAVEKEIVVKADERDRKSEVVENRNSSAVVGTRAADNGKGDRCDENVASPLSQKPPATSPGVTSSSRFRRLQVRSWDDNQKAMAMALFLLLGWFLYSFVLTGQKPRDRDSVIGYFGRPDGNQPLF